MQHDLLKFELVKLLAFAPFFLYIKIIYLKFQFHNITVFTELLIK